MNNDKSFFKNTTKSTSMTTRDQALAGKDPSIGLMRAFSNDPGNLADPVTRDEFCRLFMRNFTGQNSTT